jgi:hypothetical protein
MPRAYPHFFWLTPHTEVSAVNRKALVIYNAQKRPQHSNEHLGFMGGREYLDQLTDY